ncbi:MAG: hypothetical protein ABIK81_03105 [candidate division WOR-3 bacterium]
MRKTRWSKELVVEKIKELKAKGEPLDLSAIRKKHFILLYPTYRYIGSWKEAITLAGLNYAEIRKNIQWSAEMVKERIKKFRRQRISLIPSVIRKYDRKLLGAAKRYFGSWQGAIRAVGINPDKVLGGRRWKKDKVLKGIQLLKKMGVNISTTTEIRKIYRPLHSAAIRFFGSWRNAVITAGIDPKRILPLRKWHKEEIIRALKKLKEKN